MRKILTGFGVALLLATPAAAVDTERHAQLIASAGLSKAQAADLNVHQITMIKQIRDNPTYSEDEKRRRVNSILEGPAPRFFFSF